MCVAVVCVAVTSCVCLCGRSGHRRAVQGQREPGRHTEAPLQSRSWYVDSAASCKCCSGTPCCRLTRQAPLLYPNTEELDLEDGQWEDVHVITGALKLFFRELPEPLFPYSHFNRFITAISERLLLQLRLQSVCLSSPTMSRYKVALMFLFCLGIPDYNTKLSCIYELVRSLPPPNHDTMKLLFGHLRR